MLQAKTKDGRLIVPAKLTRQELTQLRQKSFYCPVCSNRVILKVGSRVTPHFAHYAKGKCLTYHKGEGPYHEQGKLMLYDWFKQQNLSVQLEPYITSIQQQPDLLLTVQQKKIAIEFQCSRTSIETIQTRNRGYQQANIEPIWILGQTLLKRRSANTFLIDSFTKQFIHQFSPSTPLKLYYFCPTSQLFTQVQHIYLLKQSLAYAQMSTLPLTNLTLLDLFSNQSFRTQEFFRLLLRLKRNFRIQPYPRMYGRTRTWYKWLYQKQTHVQYLPACIYLPIVSQIYMKTPLWDWQSRFCLDIVHPASIQHSIDLSFAENYFRHIIKPANYFPLIKNLRHPIKDYLKLLEIFKIVKQIDSGTFIKTNELLFANHVEQAVALDNQFLQKLSSKV